MGYNVIQNSFLGGEIAPSLFGRSDDALVSVGASELKNFLVNVSGSIEKRPGFKFMRDMGTGSFRLIPFRFASDQTLVLLFGDKIMYVMSEGKFVMNGSTPYTVTTPYSSSEIWSINYSQNADILTLTSQDIHPKELRRYGATDWRFVDVTTKPTISPPSGITAQANYPDAVLNGSTDINSDNYNPNTIDIDVITARYTVTSVDSNGVESENGETVEVKCNYYITGATVTISWKAVAEAESYRVYRSVAGVYGFLSQTSLCSIEDSGSNPDTSQTPPFYKTPFTGESSGKIISISVVNGGSGYIGEGTVSSGQTVYFIPPPLSVTHTSISSPINMKMTVTFYFKNGTSIFATKRLEYISKKVHVTNPPSGDFNTKPTINYIFYPNDWVGGLGTPVQISKKVNINSKTKITVDAYDIYSSVSSGDVTSIGKFGIVTDSSLTIDDYDMYNPNASGISSDCVDTIEKYYFKNLWALEGHTPAVKPNGSYYAYYNDIVNGKSEGEAQLPLRIIDSTGTGASAICLIKGGSVKSVRLISGGRNYTSPTFSVESETGSGATFTYTLAAKGESEFPRCSGQFDQRRVFAGSSKNPLKIWMTSAGQQSFMSYHIPLLDSDRIEIIAAAQDADIIKHIVGMESLVLFTGGAEMRVLTMNSDALTPRTVGVRVQSYVGANDVKPVIVGSVIVYIASRGGHPRQIAYNSSDALYASLDLGVRCPHLFDGKDIVDMAISKAPLQTLWLVSTDGMIYVCTYMPEQNINCWYRCDVGGIVESICCVAEGKQDHIYITVRRDNHIYVERMGDITTSLIHARHMDSYLDAEFDTPQTIVHGLDHLEGKTVCVFVDGKSQSNKIVKNGEITLDEAGLNVAVGLPMECTLTTIPLEYQSNLVKLETRNIGRIAARVNGSGDFLYSSYPMRPNEHWYKAKRDSLIQQQQNTDSNVIPMQLRGVWDNQSQIAIKTIDNVPLTILAIMADVSFSKNLNNTKSQDK